jgi:hypothetical protein
VDWTLASMLQPMARSSVGPARQSQNPRSYYFHETHTLSPL